MPPRRPRCRRRKHGGIASRCCTVEALSELGLPERIDSSGFVCRSDTLHIDRRLTTPNHLRREPLRATTCFGRLTPGGWRASSNGASQQPTRRGERQVPAPWPTVALQSDFHLIGWVETWALTFQRPAKKSELLPAGRHTLPGLDDLALRASLVALVALKPGRPRMPAGASGHSWVP